MSIKPELGKYYELSNEKIGRAVADDRKQFPISISGYWFDGQGRHRAGQVIILREVRIETVFGFELRAGERYETVKPDGSAGPVVTLRKGAFSGVEVVAALLPFAADVEDQGGDPFYVAATGDVYHHRESTPRVRIVRPHAPPPPPTPIERLEKWHEVYSKFLDTTKPQSLNGTGGSLSAIIADLKAERAK